MVALPQILCQLHDHAKQYDNDGVCHNKRNGGNLLLSYKPLHLEAQQRLQEKVAW